MRKNRSFTSHGMSQFARARMMAVPSTSRTTRPHMSWNLGVAKRSASNWKKDLGCNSNCPETTTGFQTVQNDCGQGRSEREHETYDSRYVESLSDARAMLTVVFNSLTYFSCQALTRRAVMTPSTRSM